MPRIMHQFTKYVEARAEDASAHDFVSCVTGDPERMYALFEETDALVRRCDAASIIGKPIGLGSVEELSMEVTVAPHQDRGADYQEQLAYLSWLEQERQQMARIEEAA